MLSSVINAAHSSHNFQHCLKAAISDCKSALELGCGFGNRLKQADLPRMVGVEIHKPYLDSERCFRDPRVTYIHGEAVATMRLMLEEGANFDAVLMIDFLEHLEKSVGIEALGLAEKLSIKRVVLFVPQGDHPQSKDAFNMGGDTWQTHRAVWEVVDLSKLGYDTALWATHHSKVNAEGGTRSQGAMFAIKDIA